MTYRAELLPQGWVVVKDGGKVGPAVLTDYLPASLACEIVDLLKGRYRDITHARALALALKIEPALDIPPYLSSLLVEAARLMSVTP